MFEFGEIQHQELPADLKPRVMREIANFTVAVVVGDEVLASGTLIDIANRRGILTAYHVASRVIKADDDAVALVVADHPHRLCLRRSHLVHVIVGEPSSPDKEWKPDLSFLSIGDQSLLATLESKKSFLHLDKRSEGTFLAYPHRERLWWFVAGFPAEFCRRVKVRESGEVLTCSSNFVGEATFDCHFHEGRFDYLRLQLCAGAHDFPSNYGGLSGGGIWMVPLEMDPDKGPSTASARELFLAGVCCYQSAPTVAGRDIEGHGPGSIYRCLRKALAETATNG